LLAVCQLPDELFQPYASATTSVVVLEKGVKHDPSIATVFVRLHHDGLTLRKGIRVERPTEPNDIPQAVDAIVNKRAIPGFSGLGHVSGEREWAAGAYVASAPPSREEVQDAVDVHLRRLASFYARYSREVTVQREQVRQGGIRMSGYRSLMSQAKKDNAKALSDAARPGTIGDAFDIVYGMKELHSRDGIADGETLVISPTEAYNGCYGWLEFGQVMQPPFVTVAQTGSIGEAFVQFEPCAVNDDCLVLLPRKPLSEAMLVIAAACLHEEKWRFSYGRKLTPAYCRMIPCLKRGWRSGWRRRGASCLRRLPGMPVRKMRRFLLSDGGIARKRAPTESGARCFLPRPFFYFALGSAQAIT
jgi:hypothetical protein